MNFNNYNSVNSINSNLKSADFKKIKAQILTKKNLVKITPKKRENDTI
jgi:hypothetical protein